VSGFRGAAAQAIDVDQAKGNITGKKAVVWQYNEDTPYVPSPVLYKNTLYFFKVNKAQLTCLNAQNGQPYYKTQKIAGIRGVYASPIVVNDHLYIIGRRGTSVVLKHGPKYKVLATNELKDNFDASPVVVGNKLLLRGHKHLYCISPE
jgi:outer membrane protein assembly factor BamB